MPKLQKNFMNFVALGGQNPQILNLNFLKSENIIPINEEPFQTILKSQNPVKKFICVPGLTNLALGNFEFTVDEQRFQLMDKEISNWKSSKIISIAKKYFETLPYTPLKIVGINMNSMIVFDTQQEAEKCQELFLNSNCQILQIISNKNVVAGCGLRFSFDKDVRITLTFERPNQENTERRINLNSEFNFTDWEAFEAHLNKFPQIADFCDSIVDKIAKVI